MDLSFLIVNYFTSDLVSPLVASIKKYITSFTYQIIIADNSNDEEQEEELSKLVDSCTLVFTLTTNPGFVAANNFLMCKAEGRIIILINPDTLLVDNSLERMIKYLLENESIGVIGPYLLNEDGTYQVSFQKYATLFTLIKEHILLSRKNPYTDYLSIDKRQECDIVKGACLAFRNTLIKNDILFDPNLVMYSEEVDFCYRVKRRGYKVVYFPEAKIIHYGEKSSSKPSASVYSTFHYYRSKLIFYKKHYTNYYFRLVQFILYLSLLEKTILLFVFGKRESSRIHWKVYKKISEEFSILKKQKYYSFSKEKY